MLAPHPAPIGQIKAGLGMRHVWLVSGKTEESLSSIGPYLKGHSSYKIDVEFSMPNCRGMSEENSYEVQGSKKQRSHCGGYF